MWIMIYIAGFLIAFIGSVLYRGKFPMGFRYRDKFRWNDSMGTVYQDIPYGEGEANKFDLYVPADCSRDSYGLIVHLHPGGFTSGDKRDMAEDCKKSAAKGFVAASVNYTLRREDNQASVDLMSEEIKASIPVIVEEAAKLGYHLNRMIVSGGSAGGCLALIYAYRDAKDSPIPVKAVIEGVGPASFEPDDWYGLGQNDDAAATFLSVICGKTITAEMMRNGQYKEEIKCVSAYAWVTEASVPTLCAYGKYDKICPYGSAIHLKKALEAYHVPHDFIVFEHSGHGLQNDARQGRLYTQKTDEYLEKYLR